MLLPNITLITFSFQKCADPKVSDKQLYPTFARTFPPASQVTKSIIALLLHFHWRRVTLVIEVGPAREWKSIAEKFSQQAKQHNITINSEFEFKDPHRNRTAFHEIVERSYIDTRSECPSGFLRRFNIRGILSGE